MLEFPAVPGLDDAAQARARARQNVLTKPTGALGQLEDLSIWLAGAQGVCPPEPPTRVAVVLFAGDHGVAASGVSAYPPEVTAQMVANFVAGGAAVNVLAAQVGASVRVADLAVGFDLPDVELPADVVKWRIRRGSGRVDVTDALTMSEAEQAILAGAQLADEAIDGGADLLIPGDMGIGNTTPAAAIVGVCAGVDAASVTGRGTGIDDATLARKREVVAAAMARAATDSGLALVSSIGGADIAAMAGFLAQAAVRRTPVLLDGVVSGAAALVADRLAPGARAWWWAGHRSAEPAHAIALSELGLAPLLDLGLRLGEGTGALLAVPLVRAAAATLSDMATFAEAHVSDRDA
ncbi:MAG TPA: nicotinate-nucleotide--dimethylbenzimidazole phosphoribosyltransferase [Acidothermaceae bacterium]|nr:nicotinate-nucleotide--dimethylbenzimidazole phosphoribosyltransferase [Acidothermaceae bacterium]